MWDYDNININSVYVSWRKAIRKLFNISNLTHCNLLPYICNDLPPCMQLLRRVISFVIGLSSSHNDISSIFAISLWCAVVVHQLAILYH